MQDNNYYTYKFPNGLTLLCEKMPGMASAAMTLLVSAGSESDPRGQSGMATILSDLILRGAGDRNSRQLTDYLDSLGLQRSSSVSVHHLRLSCAGIAENVLTAIPTYAQIARVPHLPEDGFAAARDLALQALDSVEDEPRQKLMIRLKEKYLPFPQNRNSMGERREIQRIALEDCRADFARRFHAGGAIIAFAGDIEPRKVHDLVARSFSDWDARPFEPLSQIAPGSRIYHEEQKSEQTHIGLACDAIPETHPDYYTIRLALEALGGGMSSRLFTEVREKRGLCYSGWAGYSSLKGMGCILGYAGTSNERAQATLDCFLEQLRLFAKGITGQELDRAKTGLKASTIMQGESTSARSGAIAYDHFMRGRIRTLEEIKQAIDSVTLDQVNTFLAANPPGNFTVVTVGPKPLEVPV
jgi:predicted Zn-dependent peptidase